MFFAGLVRIQCVTVCMEAKQRDLEALAALQGFGDARPAHNQLLRLHAGQVPELLELGDEGLPVGFCHVWFEFEEDWGCSGSVSSVTNSVPRRMCRFTHMDDRHFGDCS
jgi:hypothetical protein